MRKNLQEMTMYLEVINTYSKRKYKITSYNPGKKVLYSLEREDHGRKTKFMKSKEFIAYLNGFLNGMDNARFNFNNDLKIISSSMEKK